MSDQKVIDISKQIHEIEKFLEPLLGVEFTIQIDVPQKSFFVRASDDALYQIVMNVVINARDAMKGKGEADITIREEVKDNQNFVVLSIADNGCGIPPDILPKIFDPFFTTKEQGKGTGLGLSMVYGLVKQMGGQIDVSSIVGEGTEFRIFLPVVEPASDVSESQTALTFDNSLSGKVILVAEDEPDLLIIVTQILEDFGMKVLSAKNGLEALVIQDGYDGTIDFLLTDMVMPELGGLKLASLMAEVRPETKILFMSGYPVRGEISTIELPQDAIFMAKPMRPDFLRKLLEQISAGVSVNQTDALLWQS